MRISVRVLTWAMFASLQAFAFAQTTQSTIDDLEKRLSAAEKQLADKPRQAASANPDMAVVVNALTSYSSDRTNDAMNRFDVGELELDIRSAVDPRADAVAVLAFARDVENPLFGANEPQQGPETSVSLEEAYLFLHDFGIKNLTARLGRYHVRFGRQNVLHSHDLPTSDTPFVNQVFLAPEALSDAGLQLSYLLPNPWDQYIELIGEINAGEGASSESPTLRGDLKVDSPALVGHALWNTDLGKTWNMELGVSTLWGKTDADSSKQVSLFGFDATFIRTDPRGQFNNFLLQSEGIWGLLDTDNGDRTETFGAYLLAQQQLHKDWYIGARIDWTQDPFNPDHEAWGVSPYVSWYWSEFLRFRLEYQHRAGDIPHDANVLWLQVTWVYGAHPPHPYWSMR